MCSVHMHNYDSRWEGTKYLDWHRSYRMKHIMEVCHHISFSCALCYLALTVDNSSTYIAWYPSMNLNISFLPWNNSFSIEIIYFYSTALCLTYAWSSSCFLTISPPSVKSVQPGICLIYTIDALFALCPMYQTDCSPSSQHLIVHKQIKVKHGSNITYF